MRRLDLRLPLPCTAAVSRDKAATLSVLLRVSSLLLLAVVAAADHSHLANEATTLFLATIYSASTLGYAIYNRCHHCTGAATATEATPAYESLIQNKS
uniref:Uncharacterized protein n=1 Tax=Oryza barthii TaxID=65489 RepID=A0A0D3HIV7_9ORYZ